VIGGVWLQAVLDMKNVCWGSKVGVWGWNSEVPKYGPGQSPSRKSGDFAPRNQSTLTSVQHYFVHNLQLYVVGVHVTPFWSSVGVSHVSWGAG